MGSFMRFKMDGQSAGYPRNIKEIKLVANWENNKDESAIDLEAVQLVGEEAKKITERIESGKTGGVGIFEGIQYEIDVVENGNAITGFDGYLDLTQNLLKIGCDEYRVSLNKNKGVDWLEEKADAFSFKFLYDRGIINAGDFVPVPYILNYKPDTMQLITLSIAGYMITREIIDTVKEVSNQIAELVNSVTPNLGVPPSYDTGDIIWAALNIAARIAYSIALTLALREIIQQIIEEIYPPKRIHFGIKYITLWERACQYLGLEFESTIFEDSKWSNLVYLPQKDEPGDSLIGDGCPTNGDPIYTFGDFVRFQMGRFNGQFKITGNTLRFERWDYWQDVSTYELPDSAVNQDIGENESGYNTDELQANMFFSYLFDTNDLNTLDNFKGTNLQIVTTPNTTFNQDFVNIKGLYEVRFPVALGTRKDSLNRIEKAIKAMAKALDLFAGTSLESTIQNRVGVLNMTSDLIAVPKEVHVQGQYLTPNQRDYCSAKSVWDNFYYINSFADVNGVHNQWLKFDSVEVPFCFSDFIKLQNSNYFRTFDNRIGRIKRVEWTIEDDKAVISYEIKQKYTDNLKIEEIQ